MAESVEADRGRGKSLGQYIEEHAHLGCQVLERDNLQLRFPVIRQQRNQRSGSNERADTGVEAA